MPTTIATNESCRGCEEGLRFAIREGGKTVGAGVVTKILPDDVKAK